MGEAFTILGRTQLRVGGVFQDWGPRRLRAILGALLVNVGRPMSYGALIEWAWGRTEEPPQRRDGTFHTYAKRIRNVLNTMDVPVRLQVQNGSIRLDVDRLLIDYFHARELIKDAWTAASENDHRRARELCETAVEIWVGPPLAEIDTDRAERWRRTVIDNFWLPANRMLIGEHVRLGELDAALARLDDLQDDYPDNIGLAKSRITVLRQLGRHSDADQTYLDLRRHTRATGDTESAEDLRRFHNQFRDNTDGPPSSMVPMQLPHATPDFVGREGLFRALDDAATSPAGRWQPAVVALTGLAGVGKTSSAVHWARRWHDRHGDGAVLVDLHGFDHGPPVDPPRVVDDLLQALAFQVDRIPNHTGRAAKLRELLAQQRLIVVLDNVRDSAQAQPILPLLSTCLVVVTSRQRLTTLAVEYGAVEFPVEPLSETDSARFLAGRIGERAMQDPTSVDDLAELCGGLPLALHLVARNIAPQRDIDLSDHVHHLRDLAALLSLGSDGDSPTTTLRAAFTASYRTLSDSGQRLFRLLALHPGPDIDVHAAAALAGEPVVPALELLVGAHLVEHSAVDRYRRHDLIRAFADEVVVDEPAADLTVAELRLLDFYLHTAYHADKAACYGSAVSMPPLPTNVAPLTFADERSATSWCLKERHNLVAAVRLAASHGYHHAFLLPSTTLSLFRRYGFFEDQKSILEIAAGAANNAGNFDMEGASLADLGRIHMTLGDHHAARKMFYLGEYIAQQHKIDQGIATSLCNNGLLKIDEGDYDAAITLYQNAFQVAQQHGYVRTQAVAQHRLGTAFRSKRQYELAHTHYQDAMSLRQRIGHRRGEAETLTEMSAMYHELEQYARAEAYGQRALDIVEDLQDVEVLQQVCFVLATIYIGLRDRAQAVRFAGRAVDLARRIHNAGREAEALDILGRARHAAGDSDDAVESFEQALALYRDLGQPHHVQRLTGQLADLATAQDPLPEVRTDSPESCPIVDS
jgi:tetratricopeptide (TPR) repeat protein/DNA-binding SARP family transcriptional activator